MHPPFTIYFKRILKALNLHKKTEYTARIAPAQLGKATVNRYRRPAATGWDCFSGMDLSEDMGIHASIICWLPGYCPSYCVTVLAKSNRSALEANNNKVDYY